VSETLTSVSALGRLPTYERRLENGLTVVVREDHSAPVVAIVTHVMAGYLDEPDNQVGIAHVLEHMFFKGTERRGPGELAQETKLAGGYLNAGTIYDYTSYYTVLPSSSLDLGLDIQCDALRNSRIDAEELRKELLVIIQEAKRKLDNPGALVSESMYELLFRKHRIRRWRIGKEEQLRKFTDDDVRGFYRRMYQPSDIILTVAGDVDADAAFELVERMYGDMPPGKAPHDHGPAEPGHDAFRFRDLDGDIVQTHLEWGWQTQPTTHPDTPILDLLSVVLGQGRASRLYRGVRERGWVSSINAYNYTPTELGVFAIGAELLPEDVTSALRGITLCIAELTDSGVGADELERARNIIEARVLRQTETMEGQARMLAEWQALGDWRLAQNYLDALFNATPEDVTRVAREYLQADQSALMIYRPRGSAAVKLDAEDLRAQLRAGAAEFSTAAPDAHAVGAVPAAPAERGHGTAVREINVEDGVHFFEVEDGARIAVMPRHAAPLVSIACAYAGGAARDTLDKAGLTSLMGRVSIKGTKTRTAAILAAESESLGGSISPSVSSDMLMWSTSLPSRHFDAGLDLLADATLHATFPEEELERERKIALSDLDQIRDDMYQYPMRLFLQAAFAEHPYGYSVAQTETALTRTTREDVLARHRGLVGGQPALIVVVGDVDPGIAAARVAEHLERRDVGNGARPARAVATWPREKRRAAEHRAKNQTALVLGFPGPLRSNPDLYPLQVLSNIASGLGGRFFEELRSRRSLAYTVSAYPVARAEAGAFVAYIATSPEREEEARTSLLEEFQRFVDEDVSHDELMRAREYMLGTWKIRRQTNGSHLSDLADVLLVGRGLQELREYVPSVSAVMPKDIREVAAKYFDPARLVEGIVRGSNGTTDNE
jgi:zinc protease